MPGIPPPAGVGFLAPPPAPSQREGNKILKPLLAAFAVNNGKKEGSPAQGWGNWFAQVLAPACGY